MSDTCLPCPVCSGRPAPLLPREANMNHSTSLAARDTCGADVCLAMYVLGDALRKTLFLLAKDEADLTKATAYAQACMTPEP